MGIFDLSLKDVEINRAKEGVGLLGIRASRQRLRGERRCKPWKIPSDSSFPGVPTSPEGTGGIAL